MSQTTAARALPRRLPVSVPLRAPLRVIPARITRTGNGAFAATCVALLTLGLIALLLLNTALAQGSMVLGKLERDAGVLGDSASNLREDIDVASSSAALAVAAGQLGMVRSGEHAYLDLATGKVTGEAQPASRAGAFPVVKAQTPMRSAPKELVEAARRAAAVAQTVAAAATPKTTQVPTAQPATATLGAATTATSAPQASSPATPKPTSTAAARTAPTPAQSQPAQSQPAQSKPAQSQPTQSKPAQSKPAQSQPAQSQPAQSKPSSTPR